MLWAVNPEVEEGDLKILVTQGQAVLVCRTAGLCRKEKVNRFESEVATLTAMSTEEVRLAYEQRRRTVQANVVEMEGEQSGLLMGLIGAAGLFFWLGYMALRQQAFPVWVALAVVPGAWWCAQKFARVQTARKATNRLLTFYAKGLERLDGAWAGTGETGEEYVAKGHLYARDLNVFGEGSLFERICRARTEAGKQRLADYLAEQTQAVTEGRERQEAVQELRDNVGLREAMATLGWEATQAQAGTFAAWLNCPPTPFAPWMRWAAMGCNVMVVTGGALLATGVVDWQNYGQVLLGGLALQTAFGSTLREAVNGIIENSRMVSIEIGMIRDGLALLEKQKFTSTKLVRLAERVKAEGASGEIRRVQRYWRLLEERNKEWFYTPSLLFMIGTQSAMAVEAWRVEHRTRFLTWLDAWGEFEALHSLACYAYESPEDCYPELVEGGAVFVAEGLGHPLLDAAACVRNDVSIEGDGTRVLVISGSNMAGKSTLLRSVGVATVLAGAGVPVRARGLRLSLFATCASLSLLDSIQEAKSRFQAEVERLRASIEMAGKRPPVLFLIDEIFSGTNSRDRRIAAEAVVMTLVAAGAVGALSTHDLALTEIADLPGIRGVNVHMGSRGQGDPLDFDYLLKAGVTQEQNALAIARLAGVVIPEGAG